MVQGMLSITKEISKWSNSTHKGTQKKEKKRIGHFNISPSPPKRSEYKKKRNRKIGKRYFPIIISHFVLGKGTRLPLMVLQLVSSCLLTLLVPPDINSWIFPFKKSSLFPINPKKGEEIRSGTTKPHQDGYK